MRESGRLDLMVSDIALARDKLKEAQSTLQTRLQETWCYLIYPYQETPQADVAFTSARIPTQDGVLSRASRKLVNDEALFPEIGPVRLNSVLEKYIWNDKPHLSLGGICGNISIATSTCPGSRTEIRSHGRFVPP
ncbi:hypothetical protein ACFOHS_14555 [Jhaorihella thermophila]